MFRLLFPMRKKGKHGNTRESYKNAKNRDFLNPMIIRTAKWNKICRMGVPIIQGLRKAPVPLIF